LATAGIAPGSPHPVHTHFCCHVYCGKQNFAALEARHRSDVHRVAVDPFGSGCGRGLLFAAWMSCWTMRSMVARERHSGAQRSCVGDRIRIDVQDSWEVECRAGGKDAPVIRADGRRVQLRTFGVQRNVQSQSWNLDRRATCWLGLHLHHQPARQLFPSRCIPVRRYFCTVLQNRRVGPTGRHCGVNRRNG